MAATETSQSGGDTGPRTVFYRGQRLGSREFAPIQRAIAGRPGLPRAAAARGAGGPGAAPGGPGALVVRPIVPAEAAAWRSAMARYHYLGCPHLVGESIRYAAFVGNTLVALL